MDLKGVKQAAFRYAVKNAFEHGTKAQVGAVVGKVKALFPDVDLKLAMPAVNEEVRRVNSLKKSALEKEYAAFSKQGWELKHETKKKGLPELTWLKKGEKLLTRVAPNPSGAMHFGHARPAVLTDAYVKLYGGKLILRFDDTDPKTKTPLEGIEKEMLDDFAWLEIKVSETVNASDRLARYYEVIEELLKKGNAYVCFCRPEEWKELIWESKPCPCRKKSAAVQLKEWKRMLVHEIKEEQAVVRLKTDLAHKDPSTRDWWLAKVVDEVNHPNKKAHNNHVWPSYNLASAVDDHDMQINYIIRGQEHISNEEKQRVLYDYFGWVYPHTDYFGKISKIGDMTLSKSKIKVLMEQQGLARDDDPRLATIKSFRRRGFTPEAIRKVILDCGVSLKEVKISLDAFAAANKEVLGEVKEFAFFEEAAQLDITNIAPGEAEYYGEKVEFKKPIATLLVDKKQLEKYYTGGKASVVVRLKKGFNIKIEQVFGLSARASFVSYAKADYPVLSWMLAHTGVEILMPDGSKKFGLAPATILGAKGVVHFEGIGFVNIDFVEKNKVFCVYSYK